VIRSPDAAQRWTQFVIPEAAQRLSGIYFSWYSSGKMDSGLARYTRAPE